MRSRLVRLLGADDVTGASASRLADQIRALILDGRLTAGERLPSERALASELRRSRSTITRAYDQLAADGYARRQHGGGTTVTLPHGATTPDPDREDGVLDLSIASMDSTPGLYDATVRSLPRLAALRATSGYSLLGLPELREAVAARFTERGAVTSPSQIMITSGALHALNLVLSGIARRGQRAMVEQPTFPHAMEALQRHGYRLIPTPVDADGPDVRHLTDTLLAARPHVAYLIPDFHNPTGGTLPEDQRSSVVATARSAGTQLLVDETTAELDIDRGWTPTPLAAFGPNVITVGSMSKIAWGGMRIGWIRAEPDVISKLLAIRPSFELGTALLEQCIAVELLMQMPALHAHVRERLRAGRAVVSDAVARLDGVRLPQTPGGLSAWLDLGAPVSTTLSLAARERGLILPPGPRFAAGHVLERHMRIPITLTHERLTAAMDRLVLAWDDVRAGATPVTDVVRQPAVI